MKRTKGNIKQFLFATKYLRIKCCDAKGLKKTPRKLPNEIKLRKNKKNSEKCNAQKQKIIIVF